MRHRINTFVLGILVIVPTIGLFTACEEEFYQEEQYRKEIYIVSDEENIFEQEFAFGSDIVGYVSVYAGGTTPIEKEVTVVLEENESALQEYNQKLYGTSYDSYAQKISESRYTVDDWSVTLYPDEEIPYSLFPIRVNIDGLEPDDTYFLPLRIASVSDYMISSDKRDVLLQIYMKNDYATNKSTTYYTMNGTSLRVEPYTWEALDTEDGEPKYTTINSTKPVAPVSEYGIRILPGTTITTDRTVLRKEGIIATVHPDEMVEVDVIGSDGLATGETIQCQKVTLDAWYEVDGAITIYEIEDNPSYYNSDEQTFTLNYRYNYNSDNWYEMKEVMVPVNISND